MSRMIGLLLVFLCGCTVTGKVALEADTPSSHVSYKPDLKARVEINFGR